MLRFAFLALAAGLALGAGNPPPAAAASVHSALDRLGAVESDAEGIAEGELKGAAALAAASRAAAAWRSARAALAAGHLVDAALPGVDATIAVLRDERDPAKLRRSANEVTGALVPLFGAAGDAIPADLHRLDYLGRSLALDGRDRDWRRAAIDRAALERAWARLRPRASAKAGSRSAVLAYDRVARVLAGAVRSRDAVRTAAAAERSGAGVDALEKIFAG